MFCPVILLQMNITGGKVGWAPALFEAALPWCLYSLFDMDVRNVLIENGIHTVLSIKPMHLS